MILRVLLTTTLMINPVAESLAATGKAAPAAPAKAFATAFRPHSASSTRITQTDAQDWIIEGAANKALGNTARALELFEAARSRIDAEKLPEPYAAQIHERMNNLVASVGGSKTEHEETPADPERAVPDPIPPATTPTEPQTPIPGGGSPFNQPVQTGKTTPPVLVPSVPALDALAENIKLDDIGLPVTKTKKPSNANLLIASPQLALTDLNLLMKNEQLRSLMWWITAGRIAFYSKDKNLLQIIQRRVSANDLNQLDSLRNNFGMGNYTDVSMGPIADLLAWAGLSNKDYVSEARSMIQMFDGSSLDEIASSHVRQATTYGALFGAGFSLWPASRKLGPTIGTSGGLGGGFASRFAGAVSGPGIRILSDSLTTFILNSNYMFKIAALYGVPVDNIDKQLLGLFILSVAKAGTRWRSARGGNAMAEAEAAVGPMAGTLGAMGDNLFQANLQGKANEFMTHQIDNALREMAPKPTTSAGRGGRGRKAAVPTTAASNPFPPAPAPAPGPTQQTKSAPKITTKQRIAMYASMAARAGRGAAWGAMESAASAMAAKMIFKSMYANNVRLQNKAFLRLLNSKKGFAFLKILIHSMYLEQERITPIDPNRRTHAMNFILNLARAAGICSPDDYKKIKAIKGPTRPGPELRKLQFSCPVSEDTYNYDLLMRELLTFNAVRTKNVARLRASILRDRIKMAQLLIQFQYMDGHQSQEEQDFFEEVTSKILGVTAPEQTHFLNIFEGYVKQAGGLVPSPYSVTGYAVRNSKESNGLFNFKYNWFLNPTPLDAPSQVLAVDWNDTTELDTSGGSFNSRPSPF